MLSRNNKYFSEITTNSNVAISLSHKFNFYLFKKTPEATPIDQITSYHIVSITTA